MFFVIFLKDVWSYYSLYFGKINIPFCVRDLLIFYLIMFNDKMLIYRMLWVWFSVKAFVVINNEKF